MVQYELLLRPLSARGRRCHQSGIGRTQSVLTPPVGWPSSTSCIQPCKKMRWISLHWTFLHGSTDFARTGKLEEHHPSLIWESRQSARNNPANRNPLQCRLGRSCRKARQVICARTLVIYSRTTIKATRRPKPCQNVMPISSVPWKKD